MFVAPIIYRYRTQPVAWSAPNVIVHSRTPSPMYSTTRRHVGRTTARPGPAGRPDRWRGLQFRRIRRGPRRARSKRKRRKPRSLVLSTTAHTPIRPKLSQIVRNQIGKHASPLQHFSGTATSATGLLRPEISGSISPSVRCQAANACLGFVSCADDMGSSQTLSPLRSRVRAAKTPCPSARGGLARLVMCSSGDSMTSKYNHVAVLMEAGRRSARFR